MNSSAAAGADFPKPDITALNAPYWEALSKGHLLFQRCSHCQHSVLPARAECPNCLQPALEWRPASGAAKLISWIVYHHAFHPAFATQLPYTVGVVELAEGARLVTNIVGTHDPEALRIDMPLLLTIEHVEGVALPRFRPIVSP
jgi:uncharacterized OB-fold protein